MWRRGEGAARRCVSHSTTAESNGIRRNELPSGRIACRFELRSNLASSPFLQIGDMKITLSAQLFLLKLYYFSRKLVPEVRPSMKIMISVSGVDVSVLCLAHLHGSTRGRQPTSADTHVGHDLCTDDNEGHHTCLKRSNPIHPG